MTFLFFYILDLRIMTMKIFGIACHIWLHDQSFAKKQFKETEFKVRNLYKFDTAQQEMP